MSKQQPGAPGRHGDALPSDDEFRRWEQLRRAILHLAAQFQGPQGRYTLDIRVVPKERTQRIA